MKRVLGIFLFLLFAYCLSLIAPRVYAQETGWVIDSFHSEIAVEKTGDVKIQETIEVDFGTLQKHGIYRDLPYVYDRDGKPYYTELHIDSVMQDGLSATTNVTKNENNINIRIGDADKTLSGTHRYVLTYSVKGILQGFDGYDELYWNVTGNGWGVPIERASAGVKVESAPVLQATCFQGYSTYKDPCTYTIAEGAQSVSYAASRPLQPNEGLTLVTGYEKGVIPLLVVQKPKTLFEKMIEPASLLFLGVLLLGAVGIAFVIWLKNGRDMTYMGKGLFVSSDNERIRGVGEHETVVVEYTPPEKLRPAEIGVLSDERADTLDVVATIIDLAGRGYLSITEVEKSWMFGSTDYLLKRKKTETKELVPYEKMLFERLFDGKDEVKVSSLKQKFYTDLADVKKSLYERVVSEKLFPKNPESVRGIYLVLGIVLLILGFVFFSYVVNGESPYPVSVAISVVALGVFFLILTPFMSRRTAKGREMYRRIRGYRLFISTAETHRQKFFEKKNLFNEVLPYAIVFGLTAKFAQAMKDIGLPEKQMGSGWYYGAHAFNYMSFQSSMNSFATSVSSSIASAPKSSGFSSSGGSSGGGFGGGGGGSW
ncbi:MAG: hypothetical protein RLZZ455_48 [Candidatus Parcubacteria bacterium]|jgi:uncharacterized membrane protein YgcG